MKWHYNWGTGKKRIARKNGKVKVRRKDEIAFQSRKRNRK